MSPARVARTILALAAIGIAGTTAAHHPPRLAHCQLFAIEGEIERVTWANPHVGLSIKSNGGISYDLLWLNMQLLSLAGSKETRSPSATQ
jgi:hypothetical protein